MQKQFTIYFILIFILGLTSLNFIQKVKASDIPVPIAYWNLNDQDAINAGLASDQMGNYNMQIVDGTWDSNAYDGGSVVFSCMKTDYNACGAKISNALPELSKFTILYRVKLKGPINNTLRRIVDSTGGFHTYFDGNSIMISGNGMKNSIDEPISVSENWYHFAVVYDNADGYYFYKNGNLAEYSTTSGNKISSGIWSFGYGGGVQGDASANIIQLDEIKIYDTALTSDQILEENNYNEIRCKADIYQYGEWGSCQPDGTKTRTATKTFNCPYTNNEPENATTSCSYIPPTCTSWQYSNWSQCSNSGQQIRTIISSSPSGCVDGKPILNQSCNYTPVCTVNNWSCDNWSGCSSGGTQTRSCNKISNCEGGISAPTTSQSCTYTPTCSADTWQCENWGSCSPQGIQARSCTRTYDCPSAETAAPATSQYCVAPNQPKQQSPTEDLGIVNQSTIIKSTVKLVCPVNSTTASQGSGTVINSTGLILTNKHVIDDTAGCLVGFIDDYGDEPYFGDRQIADIYKISSDADVAVLKLRNPSNKPLTSISISQSNSNNIKLGEILTTYGYPAKFGTKITYTSGDFSGVDGNYLKTTAIIEHGNSGGGAYLKNGAFIGIPTAVVKGSLNSLGYLLSINKVNSWLNNSIAYNYNNNDNNYSRVSALLEDINLNTLDSLGLFLPGDEKNLKTQTESQSVIAEEKLLTTKIDSSLSRRVSGNILLQVEKKGEGWYVYPDNKKKYYLGRPADAFSIMRNLGLGIKHSELSIYLNSKFPSRLSGKILLDVEQKGEAYYINPNDLKGYYLSKPADAFRIMRELGLGITNDDIRKIDVGETE
ncbi:MAG: trypsin-like peptidase domain-containing protein [Parcubacteria group bacterium]|nr:trypsin-like peptidase domain-containing protein [Parcubacteria group bacterium]